VRDQITEKAALRDMPAIAITKALEMPDYEQPLHLV
jgi:hypothetical protein